MTNRKSFILHIDSLDVLSELSDEQTGALFKAMLHYQKTGEVNLDGLLKVVFIPFKNQFDRDNEKYKSICERNKNNGLKGGRRKPKRTQKNPVGLFGTQKNPKEPDNDNDSKNDSDSDSGNENENVYGNIISVQVWEDFQTLRRAKKAPITENVIKGIKREADKAGFTLSQAMEEMILRGWTGFKAEWVAKDKPKPQTHMPTEQPRRMYNPELDGEF